MNRGRTGRTRALLLAISLGTTTALGAGSALPAGVGAAQPGVGRPAWNQITSWAHATDGFAGYGIDELRASARDMVVINRYNTSNGAEWTPQEIGAGKDSKWLLAYMAVGEAQRTEWYWNPAWNANPPAWVIGQNPYWSNNVYAELWNGDWQAILHQTLDRIIDQGFDGAFLDVVDAYWYPGYPGGPEWYNKLEGALTVCALAQHAKARNPEFKLVINNALDLFYMTPNYMDCIDGTVIEGLWWLNRDQPRDDFYHNQKIGELEFHKAAGKPIFALDYAPAWDAPRVDAEARSLGYLPYVTGAHPGPALP